MPVKFVFFLLHTGEWTVFRFGIRLAGEGAGGVSGERQQMVVGSDPVHAFAFIEFHVFGGLIEGALRHGEMSPLVLDAGDVVQPEFGIAEIIAAQQAGVSGDLEPDRTGIGIAVPQDAAVGLDVKADGILEHFRQFAFGWRWDRTAPDMAAG